MKSKIVVILISVIMLLCTACGNTDILSYETNTTSSENITRNVETVFDSIEKSDNTSDMFDKRTDGNSADIIDFSDIEVIETENGYQCVRAMRDNTEILAEISGLDVRYMCYEENNRKFLLFTYYAPGNAHPAAIYTVDDGNFIAISEFKDDINDMLYYSFAGDIICKRGNGISAGIVNVIPYYWDENSKKFKSYILEEISADEVMMSDTNGITNADSAISCYRRANGLTHINYKDITEADINWTDTASATFVETSEGLRAYDYDTDMSYGFFLKCLSVYE